MSLQSYDPIQPGKESIVNTPYQHWQGKTTDRDATYIEFIINEIVYTAAVDAQGNWEFRLPVPLAEGGHNLTARFFDASGNAGAPIQTRVVVDISAPEQPQILTVFDDEGAVTGPVGNQGFTDDNTPTLRGFAEPDSIVRVYSNGMLLGSVQAGKNGQWSYEPTLNDGEHRLYITAADQFGQVSEESPVYTLFVNESRVSRPQLLEVYDNQGADQGIINAGEISDDRNPRLSGSAALDTEYVVIYANGVRVGVATVNNGYWQWESPLTQLALGENTLTVRAMNNKGEFSDPSDPFTYTVVAPVPTVIEYALDDVGAVQGQLESGGVTDDFSPLLVGSAEVNSLVYIYATRENGSWVLKGSVQADAAGYWQYEVPALSGGEGLYHFQASATATRDPNAPQFELWISASATTLKPVIVNAVDDVGSATGDVSNNGITDDKTPTLKGTGVPGAVIEIQYGKHGKPWGPAGTAIVDADGNWTFTSPELSSNGVWEYRARAVNGAENSDWTGKFVLNVVESANAVIKYAVDDAGAVQGQLESGGVTDDFRPVLVGSAEANSLVYIYATHENGSWVLKGSVKADAAGNWQYEVPTLSGGEGLYHFQVSDSPTRDPNAPQFDLWISASATTLKPVIEYATDDTGSATGDVSNNGSTDDRTPTLKGTGVPGAVIEIQYGKKHWGWGAAGTAIVDADGNWTFTSPELTSTGVWEYRARTVNGAENSEWTDKFVLNVVESADAVIEYALDDAGAVQGQLESGGVTDDFRPVLVGSAEANSLVYIYATHENGSWVLKGSVKADAAGNWQYEVPRLSGGEGLYHFQASATATRDPNAPQFDLWVSASATTLKPVIEYATDDTGSVTGDVSNNGSTDDRTPTLKGTGVPGAVIEIQYGKKHWAWGAAGTAIVDADGNWTFTSPELTSTGVWEYRARTVNGAENSDWTDKFVLNVVESADAVIEYALDDAGAVQGQLESGGVTDDFRPVLVGSAEANSLVYIYATHENGSWVLKGSVRADAAGNWQYEVPTLSGGEGLYHFQVSATATRDPNAPQFDLWVSASATTLKPVIEYATDDAGSATGDVSNNGITDDRTPTLKGTGVPGAVIEIQYGKKHLAWGAAGTAIVDADGNWTFTSPALTSNGVWEYRARTVNGAENSAWTDKFVLNVVESVDVIGTEGKIWDFNDGTLQGWTTAGKYASNNEATVEKWSSPNNSYELGSATGNSDSSGFDTEIVYRYVQVEAGKFYEFGYDGARLDNQGGDGYYAPKIGLLVDGQEVIAPQDMPYGWQHYQGVYYATETKVVRVAVVNKTSSGSGNDFTLDNIGIKPVSVGDLRPQIEYAVDDFGSATGNVSNNGATDDKTPTLKGKGVPGTVIEIEYGKDFAPWEQAGTTIVDANGNWTFSSPTLSSIGTWEYRARTVNGSYKSTWSEEFKLIVVNSDTFIIGDRAQVWDFNDGTLQGWKKYGKYNLGNEIQVKPWSGGSYEVGSYTNDKTTSGYNGDVIYREVLVEKGQVYQFEFDARRLENHYAAPKLGIKVDGQEVIPHTTLNGGWQHLVGYYVATETKVVRVAVNSGVATGSGNDFTLDNIGIKPLAPADKETFDLNPDGKSDYFEFTLNKTYTFSSGLKLQMTVASSNNYKDMREGYLELGRSSHTKLILDEGASKIKMTLSNVHKSGNYIDFYDTAGHLLATRELPVYDADKVFEYQAPEGKSIGYARVRVASNEDDGRGESGGVIIRDVQWDSNAASNLNGVSGHDDAPSLLNAEHIVLADLIDQQSDSHAVDLTNGTQNTLDVDMATLLQHGEENLFIEDGKTQMRITGDSEDTVRLDTLLDGQTAEGTWVQQNGTLTVAGVAYNVYSHSGAEVEVLVQEGVKTEFM